MEGRRISSDLASGRQDLVLARAKKLSGVISHWRDPDGYNLLHHCVRYQSLQALERFHALDGTLLQDDARGKATPLHLAVQSGETET